MWGEEIGRWGEREWGRKGERDKLRERRANPQKENTHSLSLSWSGAFMRRGYRLATTENGWTPSTHLVHYRGDMLWPLGSNMPNTPTLQTISQCFTLRLHYFSSRSQHAGQAILAYQPLLNLSPFPIEGIMRVLQMQKFHKLNSFWHTAFPQKVLIIYICPEEHWSLNQSYTFKYRKLLS